MKTFDLPPVILAPIGRLAAAILDLMKSSGSELKPQVLLCRVEADKRRGLQRR